MGEVDHGSVSYTHLLLKTCSTAFSGGWTTVKLYFMMGLPTESLEDVAGIPALAQRVVNAYYANPNLSLIHI